MKMFIFDIENKIGFHDILSQTIQNIFFFQPFISGKFYITCLTKEKITSISHLIQFNQSFRSEFFFFSFSSLNLNDDFLLHAIYRFATLLLL